MKIAIIGAGLAGLTLANQLSASHLVTVFEKARGPGGRMSIRRAAPYAFDHGAQYFTATSTEFQVFLEPYIEAGIVAPWPGEIDLRGGARVSDKVKFSAAPGMNAVCKALAIDIDLQTTVTVEGLDRRADGWYLASASSGEVGPYDWVVSTAPAPQTAELFPDLFSGHAQITAVEMLGCFALMLGFEAPLSLDWTALKSGNPPIGWIAVDSDKPGRDTAYSLLVQSDNEWAQAHLEDDPSIVTASLLQSGSELTGEALATASHKVLHRWRYASTPKAAGVPFLKDDDLQLAACGDWCLGSKVEAAFSSASALANAFMSGDQA